MVPEINPAEARRRWQAAPNQVVLLDVRRPEELQLARVPGAVHIPMSELHVRLPALDPEKETLVLCHHGVRSYKVAMYLKEQGFERALSVRGGIEAWADMDPSVGRY